MTGLSGRRAHPLAVVQFAGLALASLLLSLAFMTLAASHAVYSARAERNDARSAVIHPVGASSGPKALWRSVFDRVDDRQFTVILIAPLTTDAPLPPGVTRWPGPGEALLSPALARAGADDGILTRYGQVVGEISRPGLAAPNEKLAYVRPPAALVMASTMQRIDGYGTTGPPIGDELNLRPERELRLLLVGSMLLPALILLLVTTRISEPRPDHGSVPASTGTARARRRLHAGLAPAAPALLLGGLGALGAGFAAVLTDLHVPHTDTLVAASDLRPAAANLLIAWVLGLLVATALVALSAAVPVMRERGHCPDPQARQRRQARLAMLFAATMFVAVRGPDLFSTGTWTHLLVNYVAVAGALLTLPAVCGLIAAAAGDGLIRLAHRYTWPGALQAGRWISAQPSVLARVCAGIIAAVVLPLQVLVWFGYLAEPVRDAQAIRTQLGPSIQVVSGHGPASPAHFHAFFNALPPRVQPVRLVGNAVGDRMEMVGSCPTLSVLNLPCTNTAQVITGASFDRRLGLLIGWYSSGPTQVSSRVGDPGLVPLDADHRSTLFVLSSDNSPVSGPALERAAYRTLPGGATAAPIGSEWYGTAVLRADQSRWVVLAGALASAVLVLACGLGAIAGFRRRSELPLPPGFRASSRRKLLSSAAWSLLVPVVTSGAAGTLVGLWLSLPMIGPGSEPVSSGVILTYLIGSLVAGLLTWAAAVVVVSHASRIAPDVVAASAVVNAGRKIESALTRAAVRRQP
jgi:hypothetical protein